MDGPKISPISDAGTNRPSLWFKVLFLNGQLGPGKINLLRLVAETGSVSAAARKLRMSHARSVKLVAELNALGSAPLIETRTGGEAGGGAVLTDRARALLWSYEAIEIAVRDAAAPGLLSMATILNGNGDATL